MSKTTLAGLGAAIVAVGHLIAAFATNDFSAVGADVAAIVAAVGLIFAKDDKPA